MDNPRISKRILDYIVILEFQSFGNQSSFGLAVNCSQRIFSLSKEILKRQDIKAIYLRTKQIEDPTSELPVKHLINLEDYTKCAGSFGDPNGQFFSEIDVEAELEKSVPLIARKGLRFDNYAFGVAVGLNWDNNGLWLIQKEFNPIEICYLNLPFSLGLLFLYEIQKDNQQLLYGFYENLQAQQVGEDYHLSSESLDAEAQNEVFFEGNKVAQQQEPHKKFPYNSIGMLIDPSKYYGTAELLYDSKAQTCRFLITCAHNFLDRKDGVLHDNREKLDGYIFLLPSSSAPEKVDRYAMTKVEEFKIKNLHIPRQYEQYFFSLECLQFPNQLIPVEKKAFFDIAIIQLENPLELQRGFKIAREPKPFSDIDKGKIEIAGFPKGMELVKTKTYHMYRESTKSHLPEYVELSDPVPMTDGWTLLKHKLSTLGGNSGSPIYEEKNSRFYLFGIHTTGVGFQTQGDHNMATYIYSKHILKWLLSIPGIQSVFQ